MKTKLKAVLMGAILILGQLSLTACSSRPDGPIDLEYFKNEVAGNGNVWVSDDGHKEYRSVWEPTPQPNVYNRVTYIGDKVNRKRLVLVELYDKATHDPKNQLDDDYDYRLKIKKFRHDIFVKIESDDGYYEAAKNGDTLDYNLEKK